MLGPDFLTLNIKNLNHISVLNTLILLPKQLFINEDCIQVCGDKHIC